MQNLTVAVIGAGISGLACARTLQAAGTPVVVFEKSRSLGGRLATRRWEGHVVDHGAPWFSAVPEGLREICQGELRKVTAPVRDQVEGRLLPEPDGGRWYLPAGNNRIGKALAAGLDVRLEAPIEGLERRSNGGWEVAGGVFEAVVLTAPWPQASRLLRPWSGGLGAGTDPCYRRTLTAFFEYEGDPSGLAAEWSGMEHGDAAGGMERSVCVNHQTGRVVAGRTVIVAHATAGFSAAHFDAAREGWAGELEGQVRQAWGMPGEPGAVFTHRWGFATVAAPFTELPERPAGLFLAGDAVSGSSVGAVYAGGVAVAQAVLRGA